MRKWGNRVKEVGKQVARFARLHKYEEELEFLRTWEGAPENPGAKREPRKKHSD